MSIRWDAVVDRAAVETSKAPPSVRGAAPDNRAGSIQVRVQLFGALASVCAERSIQLELPASTTIGDVLAISAERLGEIFLAQVLDATGAKRRHCRLFVDGYAVEDVQTSLSATADSTDIDIILLIAPEGG